ncbi:hypothetical protein [Shouchella clausii]|nr:hypothetical protein [Shouchella clausii]
MTTTTLTLPRIARELVEPNQVVATYKEPKATNSEKGASVRW